MTAYYNEIDPFAAAWLRELIKAGHISPGEVDERSIEDVEPTDLMGFTRVHFFAGIGGWDLALQLAGWPDDRPVWTGSCPCQPFSVAGKGEGADDPRHLWPAFFRLIRECRPDIVLGEQVASAIGHGWLDDLQNDLEREGYACGAAVFPACSVGAFHIRQRLYWCGVADATGAARMRPERRSDTGTDVRGGRATGRMALPHDSERRAENPGGHDVYRKDTGRQEGPGDAQRRGGTGGVADTLQSGRPERGAGAGDGQIAGVRGPHNPWASPTWHPCRDGKARPVEPTIFPLAHGISNRVGLLRGAGNAIVPQQAAAFIQAVMESL